MRKILPLALFLLMLQTVVFAQKIDSSYIGKSVEIVRTNNTSIIGIIIEIDDASLVVFSDRSRITITVNEIKQVKIINEEIHTSSILLNQTTNYYYFSSPSAMPLKKGELKVRLPYFVNAIFDYGLSDKWTISMGTTLGIVYGAGISFRQPLGSRNAIGFSTTIAGFIIEPSVGVMGRAFYTHKFDRSSLTIGFGSVSLLAGIGQDIAYLPSISYLQELDRSGAIIIESYIPFAYGSEFTSITNFIIRSTTRKSNHFMFGLSSIISNAVASEGKWLYIPFPIIGLHTKIIRHN